MVRCVISDNIHSDKLAHILKCYIFLCLNSILERVQLYRCELVRLSHNRTFGKNYYVDDYEDSLIMAGVVCRNMLQC
jgi:hypothetical protein